MLAEISDPVMGNLLGFPRQSAVIVPDRTVAVEAGADSVVDCFRQRLITSQNSIPLMAVVASSGANSGSELLSPKNISTVASMLMKRAIKANAHASVYLSHAIRIRWPRCNSVNPMAVP